MEEIRKIFLGTFLSIGNFKVSPESIMWLLSFSKSKRMNKPNHKVWVFLISILLKWIAPS